MTWLIHRKETSAKTWEIQKEKATVYEEYSHFKINLPFLANKSNGEVECFTCTLVGNIIITPDLGYASDDHTTHRVCDIVRKLIIRMFIKSASVEKLPQWASTSSQEESLLRYLSVAALKGDIVLKS